MSTRNTVPDGGRQTTQLPLATRVATARHLLATYDPEEYEALPAEQRAQLQEALEHLGAVQQWFPGGATADA